MNKLLVGLCIAVAALGCKDLTPKQAALVEQVRCEVRAVEPYVGPVMDAAKLVEDVYAGRAHYTQLAELLDLSDDVVKALNFELAKCRSPNEPLVDGQDL